MPKIEFEIESLKGLREDLCSAQSAIGIAYGSYQGDYVLGKINRIQKILDQIDILRPLGPDGKHGNRHTEFCGCEDNPYLTILNSWREILAFPLYELSGRGGIRPATNPDGYIRDRIKEISVGDHGEGPYYCLWMIDDDGYLHNYDVDVQNLRDTTFPELKKEN